MMSRLTVSVVIPCYNTEAFVGEAVASVLAQTRMPDEIIVVDDGSTDNSVAVAEAAGATVLRMQTNGGVSGARNAGIQAARGDCIAFLDADDVWRPFHQETLIPLLEQHPEVTLAFGLCKSFGISTETQELQIPPNTPFDAFAQLYSGGGICIPTAMVARRTSAIAIGGFRSSELGSTEDYELTMRLAQLGPIIGSPVVVAGYRKTGHGVSRAWRGNRAAEFEARHRLLTEARAAGASNAAQIEDGLRKALRWRFETAWTARDPELMAHYAMLGERYVPESAPIIEQWQRKAKLLPLVRTLDLVPTPIARGVRAVARKLRGR